MHKHYKPIQTHINALCHSIENKSVILKDIPFIGNHCKGRESNLKTVDALIFFKQKLKLSLLTLPILNQNSNIWH